MEVERKEENAKVSYGRLLESVHYFGYSFERASRELFYMLEDSRFKEVGDFNNVNDFMATISLKEFNKTIEQRKNIVQRIRELQPEASNSQIARTIGVGEATVRRDSSNDEKEKHKSLYGKDLENSNSPNGAAVLPSRVRGILSSGAVS